MALKDEPFLTVPQAATVLKVSKARAYQLLHAHTWGDPTTLRIGGTGGYRIPTERVLKGSFVATTGQESA